MSPLETLLVRQFLTFTLVLARVSGLVLVAPIFGSESLPARLRALLAIAIALVATPALLGAAPGDPGTLVDYLVWIASEMLLGLSLGLGVLIIFSGLALVGQLIGHTSGMALADVFNPELSSENPLIAQFLFQIATAVFLLAGGHRMVMAALLDTFSVLPPGAGFGDSASTVVDALVALVTQSLVLGVRAAAPIMTSLLLATVVLGLVSRTLPQLNILAVGFGLNALVTFAALIVFLSGTVWVFEDAITPLLETLHDALAVG